MDETGAYFTEWSKPKTPIQYSIFILNFYYFNVSCWMSLWFHLIWNSLGSLDLGFLTLGSKSFQPLFLQIIFLALSLSLFFSCNSSNINVIPFTVSSNVQERVSLFCKFFFHFAALPGWALLLYLPTYWFIFLTHPLYYLNLLMYFSLNL